MNVIACIEAPVLIKKILDYLKENATLVCFNPLPESRAARASSCRRVRREFQERASGVVEVSFSGNEGDEGELWRDKKDGAAVRYQ